MSLIRPAGTLLIILVVLMTAAGASAAGGAPATISSLMPNPPVTLPSAPPATTPAARRAIVRRRAATTVRTAGAIPRTGLDAWLEALAGALLIAIGTVLRARHPAAITERGIYLEPVRVGQRR